MAYDTVTMEKLAPVLLRVGTDKQVLDNLPAFLAALSSGELRHQGYSRCVVCW